jgi:hypothetical protein
MCKDHSESVAKNVLERIFPGSTMCYVRDESHGEWDFNLKYQDGKTAAVEVTSSHNKASTQIYSSIFSPGAGGSITHAVQCKHNWVIRPTASANIRTIRQKADAYLAELEAKGIFGFDKFDRPEYEVGDLGHVILVDQPQYMASEDLAKIRDELQLEYGKAESPSDRAEIRMLGIISDSTVDATTAIRADEEEFEPNRKKLGRSEFTERHLLIMVNGLNSGPWRHLLDYLPPEETPRLPQEITHVWLVCQVAPAMFVVWYGSSNRPWQRTILEGLSVNS